MKLLLAEDDKNISKAVTALLSKNSYTVDAVFDGESALDSMEYGDYDGVILDIMMPKKDGITVLKEARARGINVPVLMLTAKTEIDDRIDGLDAGADDYLTKPFDGGELLARIRAMLRRKGEFTSDTLKFSNMELDRSSYELKADKGSVKLNGKAYQLMEMFMRSPKQIMSAEMIMEHIWGWESEAEINVIWVNISYLRKQLTAIGAKAEIKATRNVGYSLESKDV